MMTRRMSRLAAALCSATLLASLAASSTAAHGRDVDGDHGWGLAAAALATARFHDVKQAIKAGYAQPPAPAPLHECISSLDGTGAMGFHFINGSLLDTTLDPAKPEALVYRPDRAGRLHLVALEYVVFQEPWMAAHGSAMPTLFHQMFMTTGEPNRYDIPAFFSLHLWLWDYNPSGLFAPFNPRVSCDPGKPWHDRDVDWAKAPSGRFDCDIVRSTNLPRSS
jgi:hypothetical protein